ncbi:MAG: HAMP domain-containing histidine kinase [Clostridia bacterium]|nr:HAMP domain-containing histidine kinase [Clostridia bacterium]
MSKKKDFRNSLHFKLILSYITIVSIIGIISVGFVYMFSNSYMIVEAKEHLTKSGAAFAEEASRIPDWKGDTKITDLQAIFRHNIDSSTSLVLADEQFCYIPETGMNVDHLSTSPELFVEHLSRYKDSLGTRVLRYGDTAYAVSIQQVYNASTNQVLGYVILFTSPESYGMQSSLLTLYLLSLVVASVLAIAIALLFSTTLTKNLRRLKVRADRVANRQFENDTPPVVSNDEVGDLARSIDRMAQSLSEHDARQKKFLQNASHELRTPLMSIRGYVEGMKDGVFTDTQEVGDQVLEQVSRLEKLTGELIYLSKLETADEVFMKNYVSVKDLLEEAVSRVSGFRGLDGVTLEYGKVADATVFVDADAMATAITNLLSNAFRFAKQSIVLAADVQNGTVTISVTDDGPGIAPDDVDHIFDRFYKGRQGKYGLGLSIVNAIAVGHDGVAHAYNRSGKDGEHGAVFEISLPAAKKPNK